MNVKTKKGVDRSPGDSPTERKSGKRSLKTRIKGALAFIFDPDGVSHWFIYPLVLLLAVSLFITLRNKGGKDEGRPQKS